MRNILEAVWQESRLFPDHRRTTKLKSPRKLGKSHGEHVARFWQNKNCILGALARLDDFLMNPIIQGHFGNAPETSRSAFSLSQGTNEDNSQSNPHREVSLFINQMTQNFGPEDSYDRPKHWSKLRKIFQKRRISLLFSKKMEKENERCTDLRE